MDVALIFLVVLWLCVITIAFDILLKREKKKLRAEYTKKLDEATLKILREFYDEDGRRIESHKEGKS